MLAIKRETVHYFWFKKYIFLFKDQKFQCLGEIQEKVEETRKKHAGKNHHLKDGLNNI